MVIKNICMRVLWTKVALALEGLAEIPIHRAIVVTYLFTKASYEKRFLHMVLRFFLNVARGFDLFPFCSHMHQGAKPAFLRTLQTQV